MGIKYPECGLDWKYDRIKFKYKNVGVKKQVPTLGAGQNLSVL